MQPCSCLLLCAIALALSLLQDFVQGFAPVGQTRLTHSRRLRHAAQHKGSAVEVAAAGVDAADDDVAAGGADRAADLMSLFTGGKAPMQQHFDTSQQQAVKPAVKQKKKVKGDGAASSKGSSVNQPQSVDFTTALLLSRELARTIVPSRVENAFQLDAFNMAIGLRMLDGSDWLTVSWHPQVSYGFTSCVRMFS
jgi:hypothetical protein